MSFELSYCPNGQDVLSRLRKLYQTKSRDIILAKMGIPSKAVAEFAQTHKHGFAVIHTTLALPLVLREFIIDK